MNRTDPYTQLALVLGGEEDMRTFLSQMENCKALDERGVSGAGRLEGTLSR